MNAAVAPAVAAAAAANLEKGRGGFGLENVKGKRSDTIFVTEVTMCFGVGTWRLENY